MSFIYTLIKHIMNICCLPGTVLDSENKNKKRDDSFWELSLIRERYIK